MKRIFEFELSKENIVEEPVIRQDAEGKEMKVLEKVNKPIVKKYFISKPTFTIKQNAALYYESVVAECIKKGIFSSLQLRKYYVNDGGILSQDEQKEHTNLWEKLFVKKVEYNDLNKDPIANKEKLEKIDEETKVIFSELQLIEEKSGNHLVGQHTAEKIAGDRTIIWLTLFLSYVESNGKIEPVFGGGSEADRFKKYEEIDSNEDGYEFELVQKLVLATTLWYFGRAEKQGEFEEILKQGEDKNVFAK